MARGSPPAVLLLLLGFVEAVDIKGENSMISSQKYFSSSSSTENYPPCFFSSLSWCSSPFFLGLGFFSSTTKDVFFKVQGIPFAKSFPVLPFLSLDDSSQLRCTKKTSGDEISQQKPFLQFFNFIFNFFMLDAGRLQRIRFSINSLRRASLFLAEPFSLIRLPLIVIPQSAILVRLKTIWNFSFPTSGPTSRTDQIVLTGLNDAWGPNYYFAVKLRQSLWLDIQRGAHENS